MNLLRISIQILYSIITRELARRKSLSHLRNENNASLNSLAKVFEDIMSNRFSSVEMESIKKIELLKKRLSTSSSKISITDYGTRSTKFNAKNKTEPQGRIVVRTIGNICRTSLKPKRWNLLLFKLIREFRPLTCLELGTALGISAAYQAAALELNNRGKIITLEGVESLVSLARKNFNDLGFKRVDVIEGRFEETLQNVLKRNAPLDFIFIDGHHEEDATLNYFNQILPYLSDEAIFIFDDISWSRGMSRAWNTIRRDRNLKVSIDLFSVGICIYSKQPVEETKSFKIAL